MFVKTNLLVIHFKRVYLYECPMEKFLTDECKQEWCAQFETGWHDLVIVKVVLLWWQMFEVIKFEERVINVLVKIFPLIFESVNYWARYHNYYKLGFLHNISCHTCFNSIRVLLVLLLCCFKICNARTLYFKHLQDRLVFLSKNKKFSLTQER